LRRRAKCTRTPVGKGATRHRMGPGRDSQQRNKRSAGNRNVIRILHITNDNVSRPRVFTGAARITFSQGVRGRHRCVPVLEWCRSRPHVVYITLSVLCTRASSVGTLRSWARGAVFLPTPPRVMCNIHVATICRTGRATNRGARDNRLNRVSVAARMQLNPLVAGVDRTRNTRTPAKSASLSRRDEVFSHQCLRLRNLLKTLDQQKIERRLLTVGPTSERDKLHSAPRRNLQGIAVEDGPRYRCVADNTRSGTRSRVDAWWGARFAAVVPSDDYRRTRCVAHRRRRRSGRRSHRGGCGRGGLEYVVVRPPSARARAALAPTLVFLSAIPCAHRNESVLAVHIAVAATGRIALVLFARRTA
jgi:hypothetical protein